MRYTAVAGLQELLKSSQGGTDASGNPILGDIGKFLAGYIKKHFKEEGNGVDLKYIDPTYMVRAIATIPSDHIYCKVLGQNAVHAAFSGYTGMYHPPKQVWVLQNTVLAALTVLRVQDSLLACSTRTMFTCLSLLSFPAHEKSTSVDASGTD